MPPARAPTTARPRRNASIATRGSPSEADGSRSARDASKHLRDQLANLKAPVLGVVVNDSRAAAGYYSYGYGYEPPTPGAQQNGKAPKGAGRQKIS